MIESFLKKNSIFLIVIIMFLSSVFLIGDTTSKNTNNIQFEYYEDPLGEMNFKKVQNEFLLDNTISHNKDIFSFGKSSSTYWIRVPLGELDPQIYKEYIAIYNPTVTKAVLYLPVQKEGDLRYKEFVSGWYFGEDKQDEEFFYPVFKWDDNTDFERYAYIKLYSKFTQNYRISFLSRHELEQIKRNNFMLHGILFGVLLAVVIQNFILFVQLRNKSSLYYVCYIILMMLYQGNLLGLYNTFLPRFSPGIMTNTVTLSILVMIAFVIFFRKFFRTKELLPAYDKPLKYLLLFVFLGVFFILAKEPVLANLYAHIISTLGSIFLMYVALQGHKKGLQQARLFMLSWVFMIISLGISLFRHYGWVPNNVLTINITFVAVAIQAVLLSTALISLIKTLTKEKEKVEIAFLHAQIKPHFLYNALNVISSLCRIDSEKARELLLDLADFLQHTFDFHKDQKLVLLKEEMEYVQAYVRIEQARFRNKLNMIYDIDDSIDLKIPPLILQPLIENAIIHGIRKRKGIGKIILRVKDEGSYYRIEVEDDGLGMTREQIDKVFSDNWYKGKGIGVANINKRLNKFYGQGLKIKSMPGAGTLISFEVPKGD